MLERLISLFAPLNCLGCDAETDRLLCEICLTGIPRIPPRCYRCKAVSNDYMTCRQCRTQTPLHTVIPFTFHRDLIKAFIHHFKYERAGSAAADIAAKLWPPDIFPVGGVIVPVPTANARVRSRGYDQAVLLATAVGTEARTPVCHALRRLGRAHQVGANRQRRLKQLKTAFYVPRSSPVKGLHIVLVDDVLTTGATLETAARALKRAGAASVSAIVIAQV